MRHLERTKALLKVFVVALLVFSITGCKNIGSLFDTNGKDTSYEIPEDAFVVVTDSTISIRGRQVKLRDSVSAWVEVLGAPDRNSGLFDTYPNNLSPLFYVWDSLGVTIRTL